ncbi:Protein unc-80-like protein, partial [Fragariocoptes setiger]
MPKRKSADDLDDQDVIPLPIQTFLWRQTSPFIKPLNNKARESAVIEQREACKSYEKVIVQNILFGLSPSLTDAIKSIDRWRLIKTAFPHVLQCCAALLCNRDKRNGQETRDFNKLGSCETKLLYTLHWIIIDAAEECADSECEPTTSATGVCFGASSSSSAATAHPPQSIAAAVAAVTGVGQATSGARRRPGAAGASQTGAQQARKSAESYLLPIPSLELFIYSFAPIIDELSKSEFLNSFRLENGAKLWEPLFNHQCPDIPCFTAQVKPKRDILKVRRHNINQATVIQQQPKLATRLTATSTTSSAASATSPTALKAPVSISPTSPKLSNHVFGDVFHGGSSALLTRPSAASSVGKTTRDTIADLVCISGSQSKSTSSGGRDKTLATYLDIAVIKTLFIWDWQEQGIDWSLKFILNRLNDLFENLNAQRTVVRARSRSMPNLRINFPLNTATITQHDQCLPLNNDLVGSMYSQTHQAAVSYNGTLEHHSNVNNENCDPCSTQLVVTEEVKVGFGESSTSVIINQAESRKVLKKIKRDDNGSDLSSGAAVGQGDFERCRQSLAAVDSRQQQIIGGRERSLIKDDIGETICSDVPISITPGGQFEYEWQLSPEHRIRLSRLARSQTVPRNINFFTCSRDSNVESLGAAHYINREGHIDLNVILRALHSISMRESSCSLNVCDDIVAVMVMLCNLGVLGPGHYANQSAQQISNKCRRQSEVPATPVKQADTSRTPRPSVAEIQTSNNNSNMSPHNIYVDIVLRLYRHLGCTSCDFSGAESWLASSHSSRSSPAVDRELAMEDARARAHQLRTKLHTLIVHLCQHNEPEFITFLTDFVCIRPYQEVVDTYHSLFGFCREQQRYHQKSQSQPQQHSQSQAQPQQPSTSSNVSTSGHSTHQVHFQSDAPCGVPVSSPSSATSSLSAATVTKLAGWSQLTTATSRIPNVSQDSRCQAASTSLSGYANNFGTGYSLSSRQKPQRAPELIIIGSTFRPLVSRLCKMTKELKLQENTSLYCDIRRFVAFVRDTYGGTFRSVVLSALIDCARLIASGQCNQQRAQQRSMNDNEHESGYELCQSSRPNGIGSDDDDDEERHTLNGKNDTTHHRAGNVYVASKLTKRERESVSTSAISKPQTPDTVVDSIPTDVTSTSSLQAMQLSQHRPSSASSSALKFGAESTALNRGRGLGQISGAQSADQSAQPASLSSLSKAKKKFEDQFKMVFGKTSHKLRPFSGATLGGELDDAPGQARRASYTSTATGTTAGSGMIRGEGADGEPSSMVGEHIDSVSTCQQAIDSNNLTNDQQECDKMKDIGQHSGYPSVHASQRLRQKMGRRHEPVMQGANLTLNLHEQQLLYASTRDGMARFSFLLESCAPGNFLDAPLMAALLDLRSPIAVRAAIYFECANFVHRCNRGQWPNWMKLNVPMYRLSASGPSGSLHAANMRAGSIQKSARSNALMYRAAGRAFYMWAEAIGTRLEELILSEQMEQQQQYCINATCPSTIPESPTSPTEQNLPASGGEDSSDNSSSVPLDAYNSNRRMPNQDQNKSDNPIWGESLLECDLFQDSIGGSTSPYALKVAACQLLMEITSFLRETYRYLPPRSARHAASKLASGGAASDKLNAMYDVSRAVTANRRWSMALSSLGFGQLPGALNAIAAAAAAATGAGTGGSSTATSSGSALLNSPAAPEKATASATVAATEKPAVDSSGDNVTKNQTDSQRRISFVLNDNNKIEPHDGTPSEGHVDTGDISVAEDAHQAAMRRLTTKRLSQSSTSSVAGAMSASATSLLRSSGVVLDAGAQHRRKSIKLKSKKSCEKAEKERDKRAKQMRSSTVSHTGDQCNEFDEQLEMVELSEGGMKRVDSLRSRRKVSGISERSDTSADPAQRADLSADDSGADGASDEAGVAGVSNGSANINGGMTSAWYGDSALSQMSEADDAKMMSNMPWFRAIALVNGSLDCTCTHTTPCRANCHKIQQTMCKRLVAAVQSIYQDPDDEQSATYAAKLFESQLGNLANLSAHDKHYGSVSGATPAGAGCDSTDDGPPDNSITTSGTLINGNKRERKFKHLTPNTDRGQPGCSGAQSAGQSPNKRKTSHATGDADSVADTNQITQGQVPNQVQLLQQQKDQQSGLLADAFRAITVAKARKHAASARRGQDELQMVKYISQQVKSLLHCPMSSLLKGAIILQRTHFVDMIPFAWNLLLDDDQQLSRTAAVAFIISSVKCPVEASRLLLDELDNDDPQRKLAAIHKFYAIWDARYQCWQRMEEGAYIHFKMAPPSIEFTLPSPKIAQECAPVVDPPWLTRRASKVEEVTISQDQTLQKSFVTATKTRRKQQIELVTKALRDKHDKLRQERQVYHISSVPVNYHAAYEPSLSMMHSMAMGDGPDTLDGGACPPGALGSNYAPGSAITPGSAAAAASNSGISGAPGGPGMQGSSSISAGATCAQQAMGTSGTMGQQSASSGICASSGGATGQAAAGAVTGTTSGAGDDDTGDTRPMHMMRMAHALFPSCLCQGAVAMINLLEDSRVSPDGSAIYEVASKVIWYCLVEDPALFLRHFFERLTRQNQSTIFQVLRRLIRFMPRLPAQAAYTLYNYLIGFVIFYIRCPVENSQRLIADTLSVLCLVVPSVYGLFLKDLKQILRKEQCDHNLLITANVPAAKKIIIHGSDSSGIPSQFPIDESTQFYHILVDSLEFFGIERSRHNEYFLVDARTAQMHSLSAFVRDHYSFKRSQHPQLQLVQMDPAAAFQIMQRQALTNQFLEFGKVNMSLSIVKSPYLAVQRVLFLHEELMKLPTFPRKALDTNFNLFRGQLGHQVLSMDRLYKICWVRLVARMFELTSNFFLQLSDLNLFLNVVSGVFVLHCEEASVARLCLATFINAAYQFKNIFATDGFMPIMPTIVRTYSNHQNNHLLCRSIEFVCKQFYIMHRKPFMLQLLGAVAPLLQSTSTTTSATSSASSTITISNNSNRSNNAKNQQKNDDGLDDPHRVSPASFFALLQSLEKGFKDPLDILELVDAEKPLKAIDFCYQQDKEAIEMLDIISLCVTVTAYASDSPRSTQMLVILEAIVPLYMRHLQAMSSHSHTHSHGTRRAPLWHPGSLSSSPAGSMHGPSSAAHQSGLASISGNQAGSSNINAVTGSQGGMSSGAMAVGGSGGMAALGLPSAAQFGPLPGSGPTNKQGHKDELQKIQQISVCIRTLIVNCEGLTRNFSGPQKTLGDFRPGSSIRRTPGTKRVNLNHSPPNDTDDDHQVHPAIHHHNHHHRRHHHSQQSNIKHRQPGQMTSQQEKLREVGAGGKRASSDDSAAELARAEFIVPRDTLLNLVAEFLTMSTQRLIESAKKYVDLHQKHSSYELLDVKSHLRLAEIANSLLKLASNDPSVMACRGLTRYMNEIVPNSEWRQEAIRPALIMVLKRLDKTFNRIAKKAWLRRSTDWEAAKRLLKGAYTTFVKHPYIVHLPHLKSLITCCQSIILGDASNPAVSSASLLHVLPQAAAAAVCSVSSSMGAATGAGANTSLGVPGNSGAGASSGSGGPPTSASNVNLGSGTSNLATSTAQQQRDEANQNLLSVAIMSMQASTCAAAAAVPSSSSITSSGFASVTVRLIAMQLLQSGDSQTLEQFIGASGLNTPDKLETVMLDMIYPMCIRVSSGAREAPKLRQCDITYILNIVLTLLAPASASCRSGAHHSHYAHGAGGTSGGASSRSAGDASQFILSKITSTVTSSAALSTLTSHGATGAGTSVAGAGVSGPSGTASSGAAASCSQLPQVAPHTESLRIAFLGLKILTVCFEQQLAPEWVRISRCIRDLAMQRTQPSAPLWDFLDFVVTYRFPLFILLLPLVRCQLLRKLADGLNGDTANYLQCQRLIQAKIHAGSPATVCRSKSFLFVSLTAELKMLKESLIAKRRVLAEGDKLASSLRNAGGIANEQAKSGSSGSGSATAGAGATATGPGSTGQMGTDGQGAHHAYHRLSAAIASLASSTSGVSAKQPTSTENPISSTSGSAGGASQAQVPSKGLLRTDSGGTKHHTPRGSVRISSAASREEARRVINTLFRRTSYPHNHLANPSSQPTQAAPTDVANSRPESPTANVKSALTKDQQKEKDKKAPMIIDPATLMASFPVRPKTAHPEPGLLERLIHTIDKQNSDRHSSGGGSGTHSNSSSGGHMYRVGHGSEPR